MFNRGSNTRPHGRNIATSRSHAMTTRPDYVREKMDVRRAPQNRGWEMNVRIYRNDQGQLYINDAPMNDPDRNGDWFAANFFVHQQMDLFKNFIDTDPSDSTPFRQ
jgi:hypothetical protein